MTTEPLPSYHGRRNATQWKKRKLRLQLLGTNHLDFAFQGALRVTCLLKPCSSPMPEEDHFNNIASPTSNSMPTWSIFRSSKTVNVNLHDCFFHDNNGVMCNDSFETSMSSVNIQAANPQGGSLRRRDNKMPLGNEIGYNQK